MLSSPKYLYQRAQAAAPSMDSSENFIAGSMRISLNLKSLMLFDVTWVPLYCDSCDIDQLFDAVAAGEVDGARILDLEARSVDFRILPRHFTPRGQDINNHRNSIYECVQQSLLDRRDLVQYLRAMPADRLLGTLLRALQTYTDQQDTPR